jgi:hypothetical protein
MSADASSFVNNASKKEVVEELERGRRAEKRIDLVLRSRKEIALATAAMGAEAAGALGGGVVVGYMQANDLEEYMGLAAVGIGTVGAMKRLDDPNDWKWQVMYSTALGMGAALASGYARDYFSGDHPQPMT